MCFPVFAKTKMMNSVLVQENIELEDVDTTYDSVNRLSSFHKQCIGETCTGDELELDEKWLYRAISTTL